MGLDLKLFEMINSLAGRTAFLDAVMRLFVNEHFVPTTMSLILVARWFGGRTATDRERNQRAVLHAVMALGLANFIVKLCNLVYFRPRPFAAHEVNLLFYRPTDSSMPSNPAAVGFSFATAIWLHNRRIGIIMYLFAVLFSFARIYCGVHYPSDVFAGALIAILSAYFVFRSNRFLEPLVAFAIGIVRRLHLA